MDTWGLLFYLYSLKLTPFSGDGNTVCPVCGTKIPATSLKLTPFSGDGNKQYGFTIKDVFEVV